MIIFNLYEITFKRDAQSLEYRVELTARADSVVTSEVETKLAPGNLRAALNDQDMQGDLKVYPWYSGFDIDLENTGAELVNYEIGERETNSDGECYRKVTINYQQSIVETVGVPHEDKKTDPKDWEPQILILEVTRDVPAEALTFLGGYDTESVADVDCLPCELVERALFNGTSRAVKMLQNSCLPVMTTAGEILASPPSITKSDDEITIIRWTEDVLSSNDEESCFKNTINKEEFTIDLPKQKYKQTFPKHTVRLNAIKRELKEFTWEVNEIQQQRLYWEKRYVLIFRPEGWYHDVENAGRLRSAAVDDPNGFGGVVTIADIVDGVPKTELIKRDGFAGGKHRLDRNGQPHTTDNKQTWLRYIEPRTDFRSVRLNLPVTEHTNP